MYTSNPNYFLLETDNPSKKLWNHSWSENSPRANGDYVDIEVLNSDGNDVSYYITNDRGYPTGNYTIHLSPDGLLDDIQYTRWYRNEYNALQGEIQGGYLGTFGPPSSGTYTIQRGVPSFMMDYNAFSGECNGKKPPVTK